MNARRFGRVALAVLGAAAWANAATISFNVGTGYQPTDNSTAINLPQFDPSLGTLTSVDFMLQGSAQILFKLDNTGTKNMQFGIAAGVSIALENPTCSPNCPRTGRWCAPRSPIACTAARRCACRWTSASPLPMAPPVWCA